LRDFPLGCWSVCGSISVPRAGGGIDVSILYSYLKNSCYANSYRPISAFSAQCRLFSAHAAEGVLFVSRFVTKDRVFGAAFTRTPLPRRPHFSRALLFINKFCWPPKRFVWLRISRAQCCRSVSFSRDVAGRRKHTTAGLYAKAQIIWLFRPACTHHKGLRKTALLRKRCNVIAVYWPFFTFLHHLLTLAPKTSQSYSIFFYILLRFVFLLVVFLRFEMSVAPRSTNDGMLSLFVCTFYDRSPLPLYFPGQHYLRSDGDLCGFFFRHVMGHISPCVLCVRCVAAHRGHVGRTSSVSLVWFVFPGFSCVGF